MEPLSLREIEDEARRRLDPVVYDYFAGGAEDEVTVRANEASFARIGLVPRVLCGGRTRELAVTLLDRRAALPVVVAPTAFHRLAHPDGELATARAAAKAGVIMIASMASTVAIEEIAETGVDLWFQLYVQPDLGFTEQLIRRAEAVACAALVVSVDGEAGVARVLGLLRAKFDQALALYGCRPPRDVSPDLIWRKTCRECRS